MNKVIDLISNNTYLVLFIYFAIAICLIILIIYLKNKFFSNFGEANVFRKLKQLYKKKDYPYISQIILPINKEAYAYYDAIVFGNKYIYILEIKNHKGYLKIDPIDDWVYSENNSNNSFMNPFYELEVKKHILNRYIDFDKNRIIEVVVYNKGTKPVGQKGQNHLISITQLKALINHYEKKPNLTIIPTSIIEEKGNYLLDINVKKKNIRKKVIQDLKNQRAKR